MMVVVFWLWVNQKINKSLSFLTFYLLKLLSCALVHTNSQSLRLGETLKETFYLWTHQMNLDILLNEMTEWKESCCSFSSAWVKMCDLNVNPCGCESQAQFIRSSFFCIHSVLSTSWKACGLCCLPFPSHFIPFSVFQSSHINTNIKTLMFEPRNHIKVTRLYPGHMTHPGPSGQLVSLCDP